MVKYFPIRTKSDHSILYGFGTIDEYINKAKELNLKHLGLADRFTASGLYDFVNKCNANNITPISGVEFNLKENGRLSLITLYAKNKVGMKNLFHLVKKSFTNKENYFDKSPFLTMEQILQNKDGIIVLTGYNGTLVYEAIKKNDNNIFYHLDSLKNIFDDDLYLSIERKNDYAFEIGKKMGINVIPSHEILFVEKEHKKACDIFWALRTGFKLNETDDKHGGKRPVCSDDNVFVGNKEDDSIFLNDIRSESLYENLEKFAGKFEVSFEFDTHLKPKALLEDGKSEIDELKKLIQKGFKEKRAGTKYAKESKEKIKEELDTIWGNDYLDYFLVVQDYCKYAKHHAGGLGAGRGCFLPNNEITIRAGKKKKIQDIKIGDKVLTHDTKLHSVENLFKYNIEEKCIKIMLSNGKTITCTTDHEIFKKNEGFVPANKLKIGDVLLGAKRDFNEKEEDLLHNELSIIDISYFDYKGYVYDIKVEDVHNYTISDVTVHNSAGGSEIGYLLGIHDTDPIRHKLLFERFLSPGRGSEYTITYKDGTEEKSIISEKHKVGDKTLYTHQLKIGDIINGKKIKSVKMTRPTASSVDVDTDFHTVGRKKVIDYVKRKYGEEKISNVMTFNTFKTLKSIKSVGQVTTIPFFKLNQIGKIIDASRSLKDIFEEKGEDYNKFLDWTDSFGEEGELIFEYAPMLEGRIREQGVHACAILISPVPLDDVIPVQTSEKDGTLLSQWEYPACEGIGLLKMDFLGLDTVDLIDNTIKMIEKNKGIKVDKQKIIDSALDDKDVFDLFQKGYTDAIFQFSSDGVKKFLRELKPDSFEDLYAVTALYRPGPMGMGAHNSYAKRKAGIEESIPFDNKKLIDTDVAKVLKDTYELIPYQESLMTLARVCADFTPYETDLLRKATAKKKEELLKSLKPKFLSGLKNHINEPKKKEIMKTVMKEMPNANKEAKKKRALILAKDSLLTDSDLEEIWKNLEEFGSYSFNKSHSVSYTLNAYISAYLKVHYPAEFMATTIRQNAKDKEKFKAFSQEAKRLGIKLYVPDVNYSESKTVAKGNSIVYGFDMASFIGPDVAKCIAIERKQNGKFQDMADFSLRMAKHGHFSKRLIESLGSLGAFKSLGETRKGVIENFDSIKSYVDSKNNNIDNIGLFGDITTFSLPKEEYSFLKICQLEYDNCGTFITYTPLDKIAPGSIDNIAFRATEDDFKNKRYNFQTFKTFSPNKKGRTENTFKVYDFLVYVSDISSKKYGNKTNFNITIDTGETEKVITPGPLNGYTDKPLTSTGKEIKKGKVYKMTISYSNWNNFERFNAIDISEVILNKNGTFHSVKKVPIEKR